MVEKPFTQADIELMDQYWTHANGGQVRRSFDKSGHCPFYTNASLIIYLARRAEFNETYRQEFMELAIPTRWLEHATTETNSPMLHNKLLVQRTAEKLRGI